MEINCEQGSPEWFWWRKGVLTASNAGSAAGLEGAYQSRAGLWEGLNGKERPVTPPMLYGSEHEEDARDAWERVMGDLSYPVGLFLDDHHDWLGASPDGVILGVGLHEIKCRAKDPYEHISPQHMAQIQTQLAVCRLPRCHFQSWTPKEQRIWLVPFNQEYWEWLMPLLAEFWAYVVSGERPPNLRRKRVYPEEVQSTVLYEGA